MRGFRTILINGGFVVAAALLPFIASVEWAQYVPSNIAVVIVAVANVALRFITSTPVGVSSKAWIATTPAVASPAQAARNVPTVRTAKASSTRPTKKPVPKKKPTVKKKAA